MNGRVFVLGIPYTCIKDISVASCAFSTLVGDFIDMMKDDLELVVLANEGSLVPDGVEFHPVLDLEYLKHQYKHFTWSKEAIPDHVINDCKRKFNNEANQLLNIFAKDGDIVLCFGGCGHQDAVRYLKPNVYVVEPAIGYYHSFAPFRIFASDSIRNRTYGQEGVDVGVPPFDTVIPHYFNPCNFNVQQEKGEYLVTHSRITQGKGIRMAVEVAKEFGLPLKVVGPGDDKTFKDATGLTKIPEHVELCGYKYDARRFGLLSRAQASLHFSQYPEPFGMSAIESGFCGTPVVTTDFGAFKETVIEGENGYRANTLDAAVEATIKATHLTPNECWHSVHQRYSFDIVRPQYLEYFDHLEKTRGNRWAK